MPGTWWGDFEFELEMTRLWHLGPLRMWISRRGAEFRIATLRDPVGEPSPPAIGDVHHGDVSEDADIVRYGVRESTRKLGVVPATADRPIVVRAESAFVVAPGGATTAFISTPLWLCLRLKEPDRLLHEEPIQRPSDTWFGPSTIIGELCYAIRTSVRFDLNNLPARPNRAVSVVRIVNHAETPLPLARLRLPLPQLSLYADGEGRLWTEAVTLERRQDDDLAEIKLGKSAPREAGKVTRVASERESTGASPIIRSFAGLFGLKMEGGYERVVE